MNKTQTIRKIRIAKILGVRETGRRMSMRCPMPNHNDKSPSFCLYPDNSYHCYGCGAHGAGAIDFALHVNGNNPKSASKAEVRKAIEDLKDYV